MKHVYLASDFDKLKRLSHITSPRIIFVGGSNLTFGLHSDLIEDSLKMESVNMGIHAGIGLNYMIKEVIPSLGPRDILIIIPEYEQFSEKYFYGNEVLSELLLIKKEWGSLILNTDWFSFPGHLAKNCIEKNILIEKQNEETYDRIKFNEYGDYIGHAKFNHHALTPSPLSSALSTKVVKDLKQLILQIEQKGTVIYMFPPCYRPDNYKMDIQLIKSIQTELLSQKIPFNVKPERYVLNDSLFYDTKYHLTREGSLFRTKMLIEDIKCKKAPF